MTYLWENLLAGDFELLARDVLKARTGVEFTSFASGPDGGIDLRCARSPDGAQIGQAKHRFRTTGGRLATHVIDKELPKVAALRPSRYYLVTSSDLTANNQDKIYEAFSPWIKSPDDVLGRRQIEETLRDHPGLLQSHIKLWLPAAQPLIDIINGAETNHTSLYLQDVAENMKVFVQPPALDTARQALSSHRNVVLVGPPGTGKTTVGDALLLELVADGFAPHVFERSIESAYQLWSSDPSVKQCFLSDDFLGTINAAERAGAGGDQRIVRFMRSVAKNENRRFIMTARDYILDEARARFDALRQHGIDPFKVVVDAGRLSKPLRARILVNHVGHAPGLTKRDVRSIADRNAWEELLEHPSYQPRLVQLAAGRYRQDARSDESLADFFKRTLDDPDEVWRQYFHEHLDDVGRAICWAIFATPVRASVDDVVTTAIAIQRRLTGTSASPDAFDNVLRRMDGNVVSIESGDWWNKYTSVNFLVPSMRDYLAGLLARNEPQLLGLLESLPFFEQIVPLLGQLGIALPRSLGRTTALKRSAPKVAPTPALSMTVVAATLRLIECSPCRTYVSYEPSWNAPYTVGYSSRSGMPADMRLSVAIGLLTAMEAQDRIDEAAAKMLPNVHQHWQDLSSSPHHPSAAAIARLASGELLQVETQADLFHSLSWLVWQLIHSAELLDALLIRHIDEHLRSDGMPPRPVLLDQLGLAVESLVDNASSGDDVGNECDSLRELGDHYEDFDGDEAARRLANRAEETEDRATGQAPAPAQEAVPENDDVDDEVAAIMETLLSNG